MKRRTPRKIPELLHRGSLITYQEQGEDRERCLGYLFDAAGHGVFEPGFGKVEVSSQEAGAHNQCLSRAEIDGLDQNCAIGMGGRFYLRRNAGQAIIITWPGQEVSREVQIRGRTLTFTRHDRRFRGRLRRDADCFSFERIQ